MTDEAVVDGPPAAAPSLEAGEPTALVLVAGMPLHALVAALPVGAMVCASIFDVGSHFAGEADVVTRAAFWLLAIGVAGAVVAGAIGMVAQLRLDAGSRAAALGRRHVVLTDAAVVAGIASLVLRSRDGYALPVAWLPLGLGLLATALVVVGAGVGAMIRYQQGGGRLRL